MEKYRALSREMMGHLETIGQVEEIKERRKAAEAGNATMTEEDREFASHRLRFRYGDAALTSRHVAENAIWEESAGRSSE